MGLSWAVRRFRFRFNGAAPVKERKTHVHHRIEIRDDWLQWGRSGEGAEDLESLAREIAAYVASMGPLR